MARYAQPFFSDYRPRAYFFAFAGYHHMCAFFFSQIFDHPRLRNVTYYMRLDTDSYIYGPACFDPFEAVHRRNVSYAYRWRGSDPEFVVHGI